MRCGRSRYESRGIDERQGERRKDESGGKERKQKYLGALNNVKR